MEQFYVIIKAYCFFGNFFLIILFHTYNRHTFLDTFLVPGFYQIFYLSLYYKPGNNVSSCQGLTDFEKFIMQHHEKNVSISPDSEMLSKV